MAFIHLVNIVHLKLSHYEFSECVVLPYIYFNALNFIKYLGHILTAYPDVGSVVKYKPLLFLRCKLVGTVNRLDEKGRMQLSDQNLSSLTWKHSNKLMATYFTKCITSI